MQILKKPVNSLRFTHDCELVKNKNENEITNNLLIIRLTVNKMAPKTVAKIVG